jgi:hypothetical protein
MDEEDSSEYLNYEDLRSISQANQLINILGNEFNGVICYNYYNQTVGEFLLGRNIVLFNETQKNPLFVKFNLTHYDYLQLIFKEVISNIEIQMVSNDWKSLI